MSKQASKRIVLPFLLIVLSLLLGANWTQREEQISIQASLDRGVAAFAIMNPGEPLVGVSPEERDAVMAEVMANMWRYRSDPTAPRPESVKVDAVNGVMVYADANGHLAQADPDGSNYVTLNDTVANASSAQWSPDESAIAFIGDGLGDSAGGPCVYILTYGNRQLTTVTCEPAVIWKPKWSANGQYLTFFGKANAADADVRAWVVPKSGGGLQRIASGLMNLWDPSWIDDDTVVFSGESPTDKWRIYMVDLDKLDQPKAITPEFSCKCTADSVVAGTPSISPDGNWVGFVGGRTEGGKLVGSKAYAAVYIVPPDGSRPPVKLGDIADTTPGSGRYGLLQWSPDNQTIGVLGSGSDMKLRLNLLDADSVDEVTTLHSREGGDWSTWTWSPDGLLIATGHRWPEKPWEVNTLFVGSDSFQRLLLGHSPDWRSTAAGQCQGVNLLRRPVLIVTGWGGSERQSFDNDDQLHFFIDYLEAKGYRQNCNLFYATGTSPYRNLEDNGRIIRDNLCSYYHNVKQFNPGWTGTFDIIGHSYGGLRARAFLESPPIFGNDLYDGNLGASCSGSETVFVENLITLGTPHGGEPYADELDLKEVLPLPFAGVIGLCAAAPALCDSNADEEMQKWALFEMVQPTRLAENLINRQPANTCYHLLAGDARNQMEQVPWIMRQFLQEWPEVNEDPNDFAVHQASSFVLGKGVLTRNYPRVSKIATTDVHGYVPEDKWWSAEHNLISYVEPSDRFEADIWEIIGQSCEGLRTEATGDIDLAAAFAPMELAVTSDAVPQQQVAVGVLPPDEAVTGQFTITEGGSARFTLYWNTGDVEFTLTDPQGTLITPDPDALNVEYFQLDSGFGLIAGYNLIDAPAGAWRYTMVVRDVEQPSTYMLIYQPERPIALSLTAPQWLPGGQPLVLSAQVLHSTTPLPGGSVTVRIARPDGSERSLTLYDDGAHGDGAAGDATFANTYTDTNQGGFYGLVATAAGTYDTVVYQRTASTLVSVAPRAELTGEFKDEPVDADNDRYYEQLAFSARATIGERGTYQLSGELWAGSRLIARAETTVELNTGTRTLVLPFDGNDIHDARLNGPYQVRNLIFTDQSQATILIETIDDAHWTAAYDYRQFGVPLKAFVPGVFRGR